MARMKVQRANDGLRDYLLAEAIELRDLVCGPGRDPLDGRLAATHAPKFAGAMCCELDKPVQALASGGEVLIHRYQLPPDHSESGAGLPGDNLVFGADDVLRPYG